jgi:hypothetical protein
MNAGGDCFANGELSQEAAEEVLEQGEWILPRVESEEKLVRFHL